MAHFALEPAIDKPNQTSAAILFAGQMHVLLTCVSRNFSCASVLTLLWYHVHVQVAAPLNAAHA